MSRGFNPFLKQFHIHVEYTLIQFIPAALLKLTMSCYSHRSSRIRKSESYNSTLSHTVLRNVGPRSRESAQLCSSSRTVDKNSNTGGPKPALSVDVGSFFFDADIPKKLRPFNPSSVAAVHF